MLLGFLIREVNCIPCQKIRREDLVNEVHWCNQHKAVSKQNLGKLHFMGADFSPMIEKHGCYYRLSSLMHHFDKWELLIHLIHPENAEYHDSQCGWFLKLQNIAKTLA